MLIAGAPENQPWMELSSQYWCTLLEHVDHLMTLVDGAMKVVSSLSEHSSSMGQERVVKLPCWNILKWDGERGVLIK
jgi:hypothetical protein